MGKSSVNDDFGSMVVRISQDKFDEENPSSIKTAFGNPNSWGCRLLYLDTRSLRALNKGMKKSSHLDTDIQLSAAVTACPGAEIYHVATQDEIDLELLTNMETPCKLAFVGGDQAKTFAKSYGGTWIEDGPTVEADLLRFWDLPPNG
jgi:hypothetical protein